jgi:hypothetical protein
MDKATFTSGNFVFEAFSDEGVLYPSMRIQEYITLSISNLTQNIVKTVKLNHPGIDYDLELLSLRVNRSIVADLTLKIDVYRGADYIDFLELNKDTLPFYFGRGTVVDPLGKNSGQPLEFRFTSNKNLDKIYLIGTKCYVYPPLELMENY